MTRHVWLLVLPLGLLPGGCLSPPGTLTVPDSPFGTATAPPAPPRQASAYAAAPVESSARVDTIGRKLLAANPQAGLKPVFVAIGGVQPEIFHIETASIFVTDGLVKQCQTDGQTGGDPVYRAGQDGVGDARRTPARRGCPPGIRLPTSRWATTTAAAMARRT